MMTTLSMLTSKKRIKYCKILGVILGFCCLISLTGCKSKTDDEPNQTKTDDTQTVENKYRNIKVKTTNPTPLYVYVDGKLVEGGTVEEGIYLDIADSDAIQDKILINGTSWLVKQSDVQPADRWFKNQTHLLPYGLEITTKDSYTLTNDDGKNQLNRLGSDVYTVYVKPSEDDSRYGVLIQNGIYYISKDDVQSEKEIAIETQELATTLPVMMYHFFYSEANGETRGDVNFVEVNEFDEQCKYLVDNGYTSLTMREVQYFMEERGQIPVKSYALTIDDGDPSVHKYAYPILKEYGINATLFLIGGWLDPILPYDFVEMREDGLELQSHSFLMHQGGCSGMGHGGRLLCVSHDEGVQDTIQSYEYVDAGFVYCYPFGDVNDNAIQIMKDAGTKLAFTTEFGKINPSMDQLKLPRIRVTGGAGMAQYINHLN
ncbi:MAG: polysaccharide deacetylase family protein [Anaerorhabdus sp.]|uniref:polysaccharide deacetylase family protein n=1 Tax=Anaerorhabdus sp. TaxID=1872524 RepID=UPI003A8BF78C